VGVLLGAFGAAGPPPWVLGALLLVIAIFAMIVLAGAGRAHAAALARALGEGRLSFEVPAATASSLASGLRGVLRDAIAAGDTKRAARVLGLMADRQLSFDDVAAADDGPPGAPLRGTAEDAIRGLVSLGYARPDAERAVRAAAGDSVADIVRQALRTLAGSAT